MIEMVSISKMYLKNLIKDSLFLDALAAAGVDNWPGYDQVQWPKKEDVKKVVEEIIENGG